MRRLICLVNLVDAYVCKILRSVCLFGMVIYCLVFVVYLSGIILICIIDCFVFSLIFINNYRIWFSVIYHCFIFNLSIIISQSIIFIIIDNWLVVNFICRINTSVIIVDRIINSNISRIINNRRVILNIIAYRFINYLNILFSNLTHTNIIFFKLFLINLLIIYLIFFI